MKQNRVTVSVVMACHNAALFLDEAITSVLEQTLQDLELIVVDDASTDDSLEICRSYEAQDSRVSVLSNPVVVGPGPTRNVGIAAARGRWLGILDSDDVAAPSRLEQQMQVAQSHPEVIMIGSNAVFIDDHGSTIREHSYPTDHEQLVERLRSRRPVPPHSSMVYRSDVVNRLSGFNPRYRLSQDYDLWLRLAETGKLGSVGDPLAKIRVHESNVSFRDGGILSLSLGYTACVCHFLRCDGASDPSVSDEEEQWQSFLSWVQMRMTEEGVFEQLKVKDRLRSSYLAARRRSVGAVRLGMGLIRSRHAIALVREELRGTQLPRRLAEEWKVRSAISQ